MNLEQLKQITKANLTIPSFFGTLYDFQKTGVMALHQTPRLILGDQTGLGKSVQTAGAISLLYDREEIPQKSVIVICQNSQRSEWIEAFEKFTSLHAIVGDTKDNPDKLLKSRFNVLIAGYPTVFKYHKEFESHGFQMVVLDEASVVKNSEAKIFSAVKTLTNKASRVVLLNATTIENNLAEYFSMMEILKPGQLGSFDQFKTAYCNMETKYFRNRYGTLMENEKIAGAKSVEALAELKNMMTPYYFRRDFDEVGIQLPEEMITDIKLDLFKSQKAAYIAEIERYQKGEIKGGVLLHNLLKICDGKKDWELDPNPEKTSVKGEAIVDLVNSFQGAQFCIYSHYISPLLAVGKILKGMNKKVGFFTGKNEGTREQHKAEFKAGQRDCLLLSNAGIRGLNLDNCRYLIKINKLWNKSQDHQLNARIRRLSSNFKSVNIYNLTTVNTVEEDINELLDRKGELSDIINENGVDFSSLTPEQIEKLIGTRKSLINKESLLKSLQNLKD